MKKLLYMIGICLVALSCERRELTYDYNHTVAVLINLDWSDMSAAPTGMSIYCYPEDGGSATIVQTNNISSASLQLSAGVYNILVFNQIPAEYGAVVFDGLESFETAQISSVATASTWATSRADGELIREPEDVAAATYTGLVVSEDDVRATVALKSSTKGDIAPLATISLTPRVVTKVTSVRIRLSAIYNHLSTRATLYGMATGYHFFNQKSHSEMVTHALESWTLESYEDDPTEGEIRAYFTSFGLPDLTTTTRAETKAVYSRSGESEGEGAAAELDATRVYEDWGGVLDIEILLVDNSTTVTESIPLADKIVVVAEDDDSKSDDDVSTELDVNVNVNVNVDINIASGFDEDGSGTDTSIVLPDVTPEGSTGGGFQASVDDWGNSQNVDIEI